MEVDPGEMAADPMEAKLELARWIVDALARGGGRGGSGGALHARRAPSRSAGRAAGGRGRGRPLYLPELLKGQFGQSSSHWRRVIGQGGVRLDGEPVRELELDTGGLDGAVLRPASGSSCVCARAVPDIVAFPTREGHSVAVRTRRFAGISCCQAPA